MPIHLPDPDRDVKSQAQADAGKKCEKTLRLEIREHVGTSWHTHDFQCLAHLCFFVPDHLRQHKADSRGKCTVAKEHESKEVHDCWLYLLHCHTVDGRILRVAWIEMDIQTIDFDLLWIDGGQYTSLLCISFGSFGCWWAVLVLTYSEVSKQCPKGNWNDKFPDRLSPEMRLLDYQVLR